VLVPVSCGEVDAVLFDAARGLEGQIELWIEQKGNCADITKATKQV
jgi:hypothetical protein